MPAVPEFLDALRGIGGFEVFGEVYAKKLGTANGNVAVTRKVAEDLQSKQEGEETREGFGAPRVASPFQWLAPRVSHLTSRRRLLSLSVKWG